MLVDYHIHVVSHGEYSYSREWIEKFLRNARMQGIEEIGFSEHDEFLSGVDWEKVIQARQQYNNINIRRGLEVDFIPGREGAVKKIISAGNYDYLIGSIHFIDGWGFDNPDYKNKWRQNDVDQIYRSYFELVDMMVGSGLCNIVGHLDLVKIWGHRPCKIKLTKLVDPILRKIKKSGMVVEINSAGLRKPVSEIYPAQELIDLMYSLNIPITLGSDAHHPDQVGEGFNEIIHAITMAGYRYIARFEHYNQVLVPV